MILLLNKYTIATRGGDKWSNDAMNDVVWDNGQVERNAMEEWLCKQQWLCKRQRTVAVPSSSLPLAKFTTRGTLHGAKWNGL